MTLHSGPYQSRFFQFISRQSRQLAEKTGQAFRHLKLGIVWGSQSILYPIYAIFQAIRLGERQLGSTAKPSSPELQAAPPDAEQSSNQLIALADTPVQQVLKATQGMTAHQPVQALKQVSIWGTQILLYPAYALFQVTRLGNRHLQRAAQRGLPKLPAFQSVLNGGPQPLLSADMPIQHLLQVAKAMVPTLLPQHQLSTPQRPNAPIPASNAIQGIAALLTTQALVPVTTENEILDVLTLEQQRQLHQQIAWEMANYWRQWRQQWRQLHAPQQSQPKPLPIPVERANTLLPIRWLQQIMTWVQTGPVATTTDLFGESRLVASLPPAPALSHLKQLQPHQPPRDLLLSVVTALDRTAASLEGLDLSPFLKLKDVLLHRGQGMLQRLIAEFNWQSNYAQSSVVAAPAQRAIANPKDDTGLSTPHPSPQLSTPVSPFATLSTQAASASSWAETSFGGTREENPRVIEMACQLLLIGVI
ncbi:MAG: hypothetical protein F6K19_47280 [Cyanothece sp. SIO1E1]|nr:hypothetical protein [Cyanothece sp. SIO1E1]